MSAHSSCDIHAEGDALGSAATPEASNVFCATTCSSEISSYMDAEGARRLRYVTSRESDIDLPEHFLE